MLKKLTDLSFKTTDGVTRFFKFGVASKGIAVNEAQANELEQFLRSQYLWWILPMALGAVLVGPFLPALFIPAMLTSYLFNTADILHTTSAPDRISPIEQYRKLSTIIPAWINWTCALLSGAFVAVGCLIFINEGIQLQRAIRLGRYYDDSVVSAALAIVFFSVCMTVFKAFISLRRRATMRNLSPLQPPLQQAV